MQVNNDGKIERENQLKEGPVHSMKAEADGFTMKTFEERAKALGASGPMSPNLEVMLQLRELSQKFDHTHDTITNNDALIILTNAKLGERNPGQSVSDQFMGIHGCPTDLCRLLQGLFEQRPELLIPFEVAVILSRNGAQVYDEETLTKIMAIHLTQRTR